MKKYKYFIVPIICITIFAFAFNVILDKKYEEVKGKKDLTPIKHAYNQIIRDRGGVLKDQMHEEGDLIILGSSELSSPVAQNPINIFPFKGAEYDVSIYGRAYTQTLQHTAMLNSISNLKHDDKIAMVVSAQWFEHTQGIDGSDFSVNFSELQFYKIFNNDKISKENKKSYAQRMSELLNKSGQFGEEGLYAQLYAKENIASKITIGLLKPYYNAKSYMLEVKDKVQTIKAFKDLNDKKDIDIKDINWEEEYAKAEAEGASKVTNNDINVDDYYYDTYLRDVYDQLNGKWKNVDLLSSKEVKDYELFLNVSSELGVKPLIILMPVNGLYYDYLGLTKEKRDLFYNTIEKMAKEKGFDVLNLQSKEYEKYYLSDVMHLGWKGWLNIDEEMYKHFNKR
ncbi:D-alanyl-lipoteichoic acid biosynthesis protein DltD [Clostridium gasigenes]|uniref:D-alanyl-lipoteichoic acid biosynthesis protein DltD n=1 Tax=Clostridium gasigenes TaxID=94869 RepID=UPI001C0D4FF7|nr:D-alanyl-lipoteichoic acid biosynthesis protein DltD [Clostridium gasigenes]MBU3104483.1 D-alanyl-lipoteichoic acid biosynthesis protein DltD [Clostridium gasigenes]